MEIPKQLARWLDTFLGDMHEEFIANLSSDEIELEDTPDNRELVKAATGGGVTFYQGNIVIGAGIMVRYARTVLQKELGEARNK